MIFNKIEQSLHIKGHSPIQIRFTLLNSLQEIILKLYRPAQSDNVLLKVDTPKE